MKARPILFSGPMVRALNEGRKTQTRRVVKRSPKIPSHFEIDPYAGGRPVWRTPKANNGGILQSCPYGQPGDLLWVRETFWQWGKWVKNGHSKTGKQKWKFKPVPRYPGWGASFTFILQPKAERQETGWHKRPGIFMPREASRLTLEITDVRVQRLQDISDADAIAEGVKIRPNYFSLEELDGYVWPDSPEEHCGFPHVFPSTAFWRGWCTINGEESWDANPWVWALTFTVHHRNVDDVLKSCGGGRHAIVRNEPL